MCVALELSEAGVAARGVGLWRSLSLRAELGRLALVGDFAPLFALLARRALISAGSATLDGVLLELAVERGLADLALYDPPLDGRLSVIEHLSVAAELAGFSRRQTRVEARSSLDRLGLGSLEKRALASLTRLEARALGCAQATLGSPRVICLETPFAGLDAVSADHLAGLFDRIAERHALVFSLDELSALGPERSALDSCSSILILKGGVVTRFAPEHERYSSYRLSIAGNAAELRAALERLGCELSQAQDSTNAGASFVARLPPELDGAALFEHARAAGSTLLELDPIF
jgi:ABC-type multidrug transport system ATPase subunit